MMALGEAGIQLRMHVMAARFWKLLATKWGRRPGQPYFGFAAIQFWPVVILVLFGLLCILLPGQQASSSSVPPRQLAARRFLARRGILPGHRRPAPLHAASRSARPQASNFTAAWEPLGPASVLTSAYGPVSGRITSIALDPADPTGNTVYVATTGGGVWVSTNAAASDPSTIVFKPLTDRPPVLDAVPNSSIPTPVDPSISIGALTVQPGGAGIILAGTGDPNDSLDSYYGAGILRSADNGKTWTLTQETPISDPQTFAFIGEGFAGFAWSSPGVLPTQVVVAAVTNAREGALVDAGQSGKSYTGLYYATADDPGGPFTAWHLATITDGNDQDVQGPDDLWAGQDGNAATAVVWNPVRKLFIAAVRYHGYYGSTDGVTWTRLASQPAPPPDAKHPHGLNDLSLCPTNVEMSGLESCPIFRGALAVNPTTGDTFAWTVDENNQDQGLWQDVCNQNAGSCAGTTINFSTQKSTAPLETNDTSGSVTILNGDYNLVLAAIPSGSDTILLAGANDLWKCSLNSGCTWRNTTNSTSCMSAGVAEYQHALEWNIANTQQILVGNDSGLWRSQDGIGETGSVCSPSDANHWQNLNGGLGSLAEVESMSQVGASPYTLMTGLGANGTAGVKSTTGPTSQWPQILNGEGGPVAIDPASPNKWFVNNGTGVSIHLCNSSDNCTPAAFDPLPVVSNADVANDGLTMTEPAPFLVDPLDPTKLLVATCRLWRGPASGGWTSDNAVTPILGNGSSSSYCSGNPLIRSIAAAAPSGGGEVVYVGTYGTNSGDASLGGHLLKATMDPSGNWSPWTDLTSNPVTNDQVRFNWYGLDVSGITIDSHDTTGQTIYVTIAGVPQLSQSIRLIYGSADAGAHWKDMASNLVHAPANALVVDPVDANTLYVATDEGVWATQSPAKCGTPAGNCWSPYGTGLPESPVTTLSAAPTTASPNVLVAGTYGRGVWQIPLLTAGTQLTTATVSPTSLTFSSQGEGTTSDAQAVTLTNTGAIALQPTAPGITGDFAETDNCAGATIDSGQSCTVNVTFSPTRQSSRVGQLTLQGNMAGGNIVVALSGTGIAPPQVTLQPTKIDFGSVNVGVTSAGEQITAENSGGQAAVITSVTVTGPFTLSSNSCGTSLAANSDCQLTVQFTPTATGAATGTLTMADAAGTQTVQLAGSGNNFDFTYSAASTSATVKSGATASYTITVNPTGSFDATFTFDCQGLPQYAGCTYNPASLPVAANATGTETLQISTSQTVASLAHPSRASIALPLSFGVGLLLLPFGRRTRRLLLLPILLALGLFCAGGCSGSGGGGGGSPPPPSGGTQSVAAGTYNVTLNITANNVQHQLTLKLIVQ